MILILFLGFEDDEHPLEVFEIGNEDFTVALVLYRVLWYSLVNAQGLLESIID